MKFIMEMPSPEREKIKDFNKVIVDAENTRKKVLLNNGTSKNVNSKKNSGKFL